jgi:protein-disulfide isomerase
MADYASDVRLAYKHYPLNGECNPALNVAAHAQACDAALASECASEQGKFWEYHDALFDENVNAQKKFSQPDFSNQSLASIAGTVGLDAQKFSACMQSGRDKDRIVLDAEEATRVGVQGTPTFFVNGKKYEGMLSYSEWKDAVESAKKAA